MKDIMSINIDAFLKFTDYDIPLELIKDTPNLELRRDDRDGVTIRIWVCNEHVSQEFSTPLAALLDFLDESAKLWSND